MQTNRFLGRFLEGFGQLFHVLSLEAPKAFSRSEGFRIWGLRFGFWARGSRSVRVCGRGCLQRGGRNLLRSELSDDG